MLAVRCDTDPKDTADCLPAGNGGQLYHVYGGLYRHVWLLKTDSVHVDPTDDAASGVFLTPQNVTADGADLVIQTLVRNDGAEAKTVTVTDTVCDTDGQTVVTASGSLALGDRTRAVPSRCAPTSPTPASGALKTRPCTASIRETQVAGRVTDVLAERTGFRTFTLSPDGFRLNGVLTPLRGVAKHQETEERASAVTARRPDAGLGRTAGPGRQLRPPGPLPPRRIGI